MIHKLYQKYKESNDINKTSLFIDTIKNIDVNELDITKNSLYKGHLLTGINIVMKAIEDDDIALLESLINRKDINLNNSYFYNIETDDEQGLRKTEYVNNILVSVFQQKSWNADKKSKIIESLFDRGLKTAIPFYCPDEKPFYINYLLETEVLIQKCNFNLLYVTNKLCNVNDSSYMLDVLINKNKHPDMIEKLPDLLKTVLNSTINNYEEIKIYKNLFPGSEIIKSKKNKHILNLNKIKNLLEAGLDPIILKLEKNIGRIPFYFLVPEDVKHVMKKSPLFNNVKLFSVFFKTVGTYDNKEILSLINQEKVSQTDLITIIKTTDFRNINYKNLLSAMVEKKMLNTIFIESNENNNSMSRRL